jgi:hypothetical protein
MIFAIQILAVLAVVIFLVGMIKPKWVLFWMKEPDRLWASSLGLFLFMAAVTAYSEIRLKHKAPQVREPAQERSADQRNELQLGR